MSLWFSPLNPRAFIPVKIEWDLEPIPHIEIAVGLFKTSSSILAESYHLISSPRGQVSLTPKRAGVYEIRVFDLESNSVILRTDLFRVRLPHFVSGLPSTKRPSLFKAKEFSVATLCLTDSGGDGWVSGLQLLFECHQDIVVIGNVSEAYHKRMISCGWIHERFFHAEISDFLASEDTKGLFILSRFPYHDATLRDADGLRALIVSFTNPDGTLFQIAAASLSSGNNISDLAAFVDKSLGPDAVICCPGVGSEGDVPHFETFGGGGPSENTCWSRRNSIGVSVRNTQKLEMKIEGTDAAVTVLATKIKLKFSQKETELTLEGLVGPGVTASGKKLKDIEPCVNILTTAAGSMSPPGGNMSPVKSEDSSLSLSPLSGSTWRRRGASVSESLKEQTMRSIASLEAQRDRELAALEITMAGEAAKRDEDFARARHNLNEKHLHAELDIDARLQLNLSAFRPSAQLLALQKKVRETKGESETENSNSILMRKLEETERAAHHERVHYWISEQKENLRRLFATQLADLNSKFSAATDLAVEKAAKAATEIDEKLKSRLGQRQRDLEGNLSLSARRGNVEPARAEIGSRKNFLISAASNRRANPSKIIEPLSANTSVTSSPKTDAEPPPTAWTSPSPDIAAPPVETPEYFSDEKIISSKSGGEARDSDGEKSTSRSLSVTTPTVSPDKISTVSPPHRQSQSRSQSPSAVSPPTRDTSLVLSLPEADRLTLEIICRALQHIHAQRKSGEVVRKPDWFSLSLVEYISLPLLLLSDFLQVAEVTAWTASIIGTTLSQPLSKSQNDLVTDLPPWLAMSVISHGPALLALNYAISFPFEFDESLMDRSEIFSKFLSAVTTAIEAELTAENNSDSRPLALFSHLSSVPLPLAKALCRTLHPATLVAFSVADILSKTNVVEERQWGEIYTRILERAQVGERESTALLVDDMPPPHLVGYLSQSLSHSLSSLPLFSRHFEIFSEGLNFVANLSLCDSEEIKTIFSGMHSGENSLKYGEWPVAGVSFAVFELFGCGAIVENMIRALPLALLAENIPAIDLWGCMSVGEGGLNFAVSSLPLVTHIDFNGCVLVSDEIVSAIGRTARNLKFLQLGGCVKVTDKGVINLVTNLPTENISVPHTAISPHNSKSPPAMRQISCPTLRKLSLHCNRNLTNASLEKIGEILIGLEDLCIFGCYRMTDDGLISFAVAGSLLQKLNTSGCYKITSTGTRYLLNHNPSLLLYHKAEAFYK